MIRQNHAKSEVSPGGVLVNTWRYCADATGSWHVMSHCNWDQRLEIIVPQTKDSLASRTHANDVNHVKPLVSLVLKRSPFPCVPWSPPKKTWSMGDPTTIQGSLRWECLTPSSFGGMTTPSYGNTHLGWWEIITPQSDLKDLKRIYRRLQSRNPKICGVLPPLGWFSSSAKTLIFMNMSAPALSRLGLWTCRSASTGMAGHHRFFLLTTMANLEDLQKKTGQAYRRISFHANLFAKQRSDPQSHHVVQIWDTLLKIT